MENVLFTKLPFKPFSDQACGRYCSFSRFKSAFDNFYLFSCSRNAQVAFLCESGNDIFAQIWLLEITLTVPLMNNLLVYLSTTVQPVLIISSIFKHWFTRPILYLEFKQNKECRMQRQVTCACCVELQDRQRGCSSHGARYLACPSRGTRLIISF